jgi:hypothetical protein
MNDIATQQRFVQLRCEGWSFARIAEELRALSTGRLFYLAESFRRRISGITGFSSANRSFHVLCGICRAARSVQLD